MARGIFQHVVQEEDGDIRASATVTLYEMNGTTPLAASVYAASSGGSPIGNVLTANALGIVEGYIEIAQYVKAEVGGVQTTQAFWPDPGQITTLTQTQTLTNKTLTSPTITTPTISNPTITGNALGGAFYDAGGMVVNVKKFGAGPGSVGIGGNGTADTTAIEAAIAAAKAASVAMYALNDDGRLVTLYFPAGRYNIIRPIDLDGLVGIRVVGAGYEATSFGIATGSGSNNAAYWSTKSMMSMVGNNFCRLEGFSLTPSNGVSAPIPECGLLVATNSAYTNWLGSSEDANVSNRLEFYSVRMSGAFTKAAHASFGNVSSVYQSCEFSRSKSLNTTYQNGTTIDQACLVLSRDNEIAVTQCGSVSFINPETIDTSNSDLTFIDCEVHDGCQGGVGGATPNSCTCSAVWIEEGYDITFIGGNWGCAARGASPVDSAPSCGYLRLSMGKGGNHSSLTGCRNILIENVHWLSEFGDVPDMGIRLTSNIANDAHVLRSKVEYYPTNNTDEINHPGPAIIASDIVIRNCRINIQKDSGAALINGGRAATGGSTVANFMRWRIENVNLMDEEGELNQANWMVFGGSETGLFTDCDFDCQGAPLIGNGSTFVRGHLGRPGTITGLTITHGDYEIRGGGTVSLTDNDTGYYGLGSASLTETAIAPVRVSQACKVFNLRTATATAPGGAISLTCTLRKATPSTTMTFADTALTHTIATTSLTGADTTHFVDLAAGDVIDVSVVNPNTGATTAWCTWSLSAIPI